MRVLVKFLDEIVKVGDHITTETRDKYGQIFKGGVALLGVFLIGISQAFPILLDHEYEARKLQYEVEAREGKSLDDIDCEKIKDRSKCKLAKYKNTAVSSTAKLALNFVFLCFYVGITLIFISVIGFVLGAEKT